MADCDFEVKSVDNVVLSGLKMDNIKNLSDLNFVQAGTIMKDFLSGKMPVNFNANVYVNNPNKKTAAVNKLEWILLIDDKQITDGVITDRIEIPAKTKSLIPIKINIDLAKIFKGESRDKLLELGFNLKDIKSASSRLSLKIKPSISIAGKDMLIPGYITVKP